MGVEKEREREEIAINFDLTPRRSKEEEVDEGLLVCSAEILTLGPFFAFSSASACAKKKPVAESRDAC